MKRVLTLSAADARALYKTEDVAFVDLRDSREIDREGTIPGAFHCPRGILEFWIDLASPYHRPFFAQQKSYVFFCAAGLRSALAAETAMRMGLHRVAHIGGGFSAWCATGGPIGRPPVRVDIATGAISL
jgi:rhodanese-related sulfurtransferase